MSFSLRPLSFRTRGTLLLGLAALILILGVLGAILLSRAVDLYRGSAILEQRLQLRAAAEGAVVLLSPNPVRALEPITEGRCRVDFGTAAADGEFLRVPLDARLLGNDQRVVLEQRYSASFFRSSTTSGWTFSSLDKEVLR